MNFPHCIPSIQIGLRNLGNLSLLVSHWLADRPQLQICQRLDRSNTRYWQGYDPKTGSSFTATSEAEMRFWIEQRDRDVLNSLQRRNDCADWV